MTRLFWAVSAGLAFAIAACSGGSGGDGGVGGGKGGGGDMMCPLPVTDSRTGECSLLTGPSPTSREYSASCTTTSGVTFCECRQSGTKTKDFLLQSCNGLSSAYVTECGFPPCQFSHFNIYTLDPAAKEPRYLSAAANGNRIGVAYFSMVGDGGVAILPEDGGPEAVTNYDLYYLEFNNGTASAREKIATVQRVYGVSLAFQASGEPAVAYLGGGSDMSAYWFQSDAVVSFRNGGTWTTEVVATQGNEANCGSAVSDRGFVVGLFPSLVFIGNTGYLAYRDGHGGQFPQQDWAASDLEIATRTGANAWAKNCLIAGGDNKQAWGGHNKLINAGGALAITSDKIFGGADTTASNVIFNYVQSDGGWSLPQSVLPVANTQSGPSPAWDSQEKFGIATINKSTGELYMLTSANGRNWSSPDPVYAAGSGGWYPSLAWDPVYHEPAIAFYICDTRAGQNEGFCPAADDKLVVTQRNASVGNWREEDVDLEGGVQTQLGFFASGKRWLVYRDPRSGVVKAATEK